VRCHWIDPDALSVFATVDSPQGFTFAGPRHALAALDQEQRTVGGALDQTGAGIEKLIGPPFQRHPAMGTPIGVHIHLTRSPHGQNPELIKIEPEAFAFNQRSAVAQVFQRGLLVA
jgi:hypothetical protein